MRHSVGLQSFLKMINIPPKGLLKVLFVWGAGRWTALGLEEFWRTLIQRESAGICGCDELGKYSSKLGDAFDMIWDLQHSLCCLGLLEQHPRTFSHACLWEENVLGQPQILCSALNLRSENNFDYKLFITEKWGGRGIIMLEFSL